jgi:hypothetical protein
VDSLLEGDGFEPSVPRKGRPFVRTLLRVSILWRGTGIGGEIGEDPSLV